MSEEQQRKTALVEKPISVEYDFGNLAVFDTNPLDKSQLQSETKESHLKSVARDNIQLLVNQILALPVKTTTENNNNGQNSTMTLFQLPRPTTALPREKPVPKQKALTKWELFAKKKGIQKKAKDGKQVYDETRGEWVNKWGYKGIKNRNAEDYGIIELDDKKTNNNNKQGDKDGLIDPRSLRREERKRLIKKNQRLQKKNAGRVSK